MPNTQKLLMIARGIENSGLLDSNALKGFIFPDEFMVSVSQGRSFQIGTTPSSDLSFVYVS